MITRVALRIGQYVAIKKYVRIPAFGASDNIWFGERGGGEGGGVKGMPPFFFFFHLTYQV